MYKSTAKVRILLQWGLSGIGHGMGGTRGTYPQKLCKLFIKFWFLQ